MNLINIVKVGLGLSLVALPTTALAQSEMELTKAAQNPIASMISLPSMHWGLTSGI